MKIAERIFGVILLIIIVGMIYLITSLFVELPFPDSYKKYQKEQVEQRMKNDPFYNLANNTVVIIKQRDSLQHLLDSLTKK